MRFYPYDNDKKSWQMLIPHQDYYSVLDVSHIVWASSPQIYQEIQHGRLRAVTVGKRIAVAHDELVRYCKEKASRKLNSKNPDVKPYIPTELKGTEPIVVVGDNRS